MDSLRSILRDQKSLKGAPLTKKAEQVQMSELLVEMYSRVTPYGYVKNPELLRLVRRHAGIYYNESRHDWVFDGSDKYQRFERLIDEVKSRLPKYSNEQILDVVVAKLGS